MALDPNLLSLLGSFLPGRVGSGGQPMLPQFSGGDPGQDQSLQALMTSLFGPRHLDTAGQIMLPGQGQGPPKFPGLDGYQALQQGIGSGLMQPQTQPSASMLPMGFSNKPQQPLLPNPVFQPPGPPLRGKKPYTV